MQELIDIYYASVGRSSNLLLNLPPDRRGLIHEIDVERLRGLRAWLDATFADDLARGARVSASATRGDDASFAAGRVLDGDPRTYWAAPDGTTEASLVLELPRPARFDQVRLREAVELGQRVFAWAIDAEVGGRWRPLAQATTVGVRRIVRFEPVTASRVRVRIAGARACPAIAELSLFLSAPSPRWSQSRRRIPWALKHQRATPSRLLRSRGRRRGPPGERAVHQEVPRRDRGDRDRVGERSGSCRAR